MILSGHYWYQSILAIKLNIQCVSHVPCDQMLRLLTLSPVKQAQFALVVSIVLTVSKRHHPV